MEWEVRLADGRVLTSLTHKWSDDWDGVLTVAVWDDAGNRTDLNWSDGRYGLPGTWKNSAEVSDKEFQRVLKEAKATRTAPSRRG